MASQRLKAASGRPNSSAAAREKKGNRPDINCSIVWLEITISVVPTGNKNTFIFVVLNCEIGKKLIVVVDGLSGWLG